MNTVPFIKQEKLLEYLDSEIARSLEGRNVRSLGAYAWVDEDTPSDEYIGLAKWELDSADSPIVSGWDSVPEDVKARMVALVSAGEDLIGLIEMSRKAIGFSIFYSDLAKKSISNLHDPFWIHHLNAMTMLSMASERLRDVLLQGCFQVNAKEYKRGKPDEAKHFSHPFVNTEQLNLSSDYTVELKELVELAELIYSQGIDKRNSLVHELASELGRLARDTAGINIRSVFEFPSAQSFEDSKNAWAAACERHEAEIEGAVQTVITWYERLIKATSIVFDIEHCLRKNRDG